MVDLRRLLFRSPTLAALVVLASLAVRLAVPAGFMPVVGAHGVTLSICSGYGPMRMGHAVMKHHNGDDAEAKGRCAFADLALPAIGGADPAQLVEALLFILALGLVPSVSMAIRGAARLRPPLRGPPALG